MVDKSFITICAQNVILSLECAPFISCSILIQSNAINYDNFIFIGKKVIAIYYSNNLIFWARNKKDIVEFDVQLCAEEIDVEVLLNFLEFTLIMILRIEPLT